MRSHKKLWFIPKKEILSDTIAIKWTVYINLPRQAWIQISKKKKRKIMRIEYRTGLLIIYRRVRIRGISFLNIRNTFLFYYFYLLSLLPNIFLCGQKSFCSWKKKMWEKSTQQNEGISHTGVKAIWPKILFCKHWEHLKHPM